jgi:predicted dehydrogenase
MARLRVLLLGCGYIAQAEHIPNWRNSRRGELVGIVDPRAELAREAGDVLGVPWFTHVERALDQCPCDAVHICTPAEIHLPLIRLAMQAGKHVLCEKPLAPSSTEAAEAGAVARQTGLVLMVGYPRVFDTDLTEVGERMRRGDLGRIVGVQSIWKLSLPPVYEGIGSWPRTTLAPQDLTGAGYLRHHLMDESIHHLNLFRRWLGNLIQVDVVQNAGSLWHVTMTFAGGIPVWHTYVSPITHGEEFWVYGEGGAMYARPWSPHFPWSYGYCEFTRRDSSEVVIPTLARQNPYLAQINEFAKSVAENRPPMTEAADAVEDIRMVERIVAAAAAREASTGTRGASGGGKGQA